jgi:hypothetical protein
MKNNIIIIAFFMLASIFGQAQVTPGDTTEYIIKLSNGSEYVGMIVQDDGREMLIQSKSVGKIYLKKTDIISISKNDKTHAVVIDGEVWDNNTFSTRYFVTTNGLPIKKGENYYMINFYGPEMHVAVSNSLNVGLMTTWIGAPFLFTLKKSFPTKRKDVNFALGSLTGNLGYLNSFKGIFSVNFMSITKGDRENNLTFSSGFVYYSNGNSSMDGYYTSVRSSGVLNSIAGTLRIGKSTSLIFDSMFGTLNTTRERLDEGYNYYLDPNTQEYVSSYYNNGLVRTRTNRGFFMFMPGIRVMQTKTRAFQFFLNYTAVENNNFGFPMVSWLRTF